MTNSCCSGVSGEDAAAGCAGWAIGEIVEAEEASRRFAAARLCVHRWCGDIVGGFEIDGGTVEIGVRASGGFEQRIAIGFDVHSAGVHAPEELVRRSLASASGRGWLDWR